MHNKNFSRYTQCYNLHNTGSGLINETWQYLIVTIYQMLVDIYLHSTEQSWNQFLLVVKATALKQQISKFYLQIQC